ncbi:hypothetical protein BH23CHL8_BH23CHL8_26490 [soil metagenome]
MNKKSRGFQPDAKRSSPSEEAPAGATPPGTSEPGTPRAASRRQERTRATRRDSSNARGGLGGYRNLLLAGVALLGVGIVAIFLVGGTSAARYVCDSLLTPPPGASIAPVAGPVASAAPTPQLGFATTDLGRGHVSTGTTVRFAFCPPTSGDHWTAAGRAPLRRDVYGPGDDVSPGNWVHNLEHGYVVIAYREEPSADVLAGIREVFDTAEQGPAAAQCGIPNKVMAVQFDEMSEAYAVLAWDRAMLLPEWDTGSALAFANQWQDAPQSPERGVC